MTDDTNTTDDNTTDEHDNDIDPAVMDMADYIAWRRGQDRPPRNLDQLPMSEYIKARREGAT